MNISSAQSYQIATIKQDSYQRANHRSDTADDGAMIQTDTVSLSPEAKRLSEVSKAYSQMYDPHAMSPNQMVALAQSLYADGAITAEQSLRMQFVLDPAQMSPDGIPLDHDKPQDQIEIWSTQLELKKKFNQPENDIKLTESILSVLKAIS